MQNQVESNKPKGGYREGAGRPTKEEYEKKHAKTLREIERRARIGMDAKDIALLVDTGLSAEKVSECYALQISKGKAYLREMLCEAAVAKVAQGSEKMIRYMCDVHLGWSAKAEEPAKIQADYHAEQSRLITDLLRQQLITDQPTVEKTNE